MLVQLRDNNWLDVIDPLPLEDDVLWKAFSVCDAAKVNFIDLKSAHWDGVYRFYNRAKHRLPRPLLSMLKRVCKENNLPLVLQDLRPASAIEVMPIEQIGIDFLPGITLDEFQLKAIHTGCKTEVGIFCFPTGAGKTEIIAGLCKAISCKTLIIANQKVVLDQIKQRLELRDITDDVGLFYAGKRPNGQDIVVGSIDSLIAPTKQPQMPTRTAKDRDSDWKRKLKRFEQQDQAFLTRIKNAKFVQKYAKEAEMLIVDEVDLAASKKYKALFRFLYKGRRRYGFSGTPFDQSKPIQNLTVQSHMGGIIATESLQAIQDLNRIIKIEYSMIMFDGNPHEASTYDIAIKDNMIESRKFWRTIAGVCKRYPNFGTLILVDREELGANLHGELERQGIASAFIYGKTAKKQRDATLARFEKRELKVLIGGKILNRGLDLKGGCEVLIITTGGKLRSDFVQKIGRAVRRNSRGVGLVFDIFYRTNRILYAHSRARLKIVVDLGYKTQVIHAGGVISGEDFIKRRFKLPTPKLVKSNGISER